MSDLKLTGQVKEILPVENGVSQSGKEWSKREFVIETKDQYPKLVAFTLFGDKTTLINEVKVGDDVEVHFNLESREYNGKYYHNINAWKVDKLSSSEPIESNNKPIEPEEGEDLPF